MSTTAWSAAGGILPQGRAGGKGREEIAGSYTPVALAVPVQLVVEFDLDWAATGSVAHSDR